jgi:hypothetical protein
MSYTVKWIHREGDKPVNGPERYLQSSDALLFAHATLDWQVLDVWVEDNRGQRIYDKAAIVGSR